MRPGQAAAVIIPGEQTIWKTVNIDPVSVNLPLEVRPRLGWLGWLLLVPLLLLFIAGGSIFFVIDPPAVLRTPSLWIPIGLMLLMALLATSIAVTLMWERIARHRLVVDELGFLDTRISESTFLWTDVVEAVPFSDRGGGFGGIELRFGEPVVATHNPFRIGALSFMWRRPPKTVYVPLLLLSMPHRLLGLTILTLVRDRGGRILPDPVTGRGEELLRHF